MRNRFYKLWLFLICISYITFSFALATTHDIKTFPDIQGHWVQARIEAMATLGLLGGYRGTDFFCPDFNLSREDAAIMFIQANKIVPRLVEKTSFEDIYPEYWASPYIEEAARQKFLSGYEGKQFFPRGIINRTEGVLIAANFAGIRSVDSVRKIAPDLAEGYWANRYLTAAADNKLLPPSWNIKIAFKPLQPVTRAEMVYMLTRAPFIRKQIEAVFGNNWFPTNEPKIKISTKKIQEVLPPEVSIQQETIFDAFPTQVKAGESVTLSVYTSQLQLAKPIQSVYVDLSTLGRLAKTFLLDDGNWSDEVAGDGTYTINVRLSKATQPGQKVCPVVITDTDGTSIEGEISITVE